MRITSVGSYALIADSICATLMPSFIPRMSNPAGLGEPSAALSGEPISMRIKRIAEEIAACLNKNFKLVLKSMATSALWGKVFVIRKISLKKGAKIQVVLLILFAIPHEYMTPIVASEVVHAVMNRIKDENVFPAKNKIQINPLVRITVRSGK